LGIPGYYWLSFVLCFSGCSINRQWIIFNEEENNAQSISPLGGLQLFLVLEVTLRSVAPQNSITTSIVTRRLLSATMSADQVYNRIILLTFDIATGI
jgi:hypothetical protein